MVLAKVFCVKQQELASCCTHCSASPSSSRCSQTIQAVMRILIPFYNLLQKNTWTLKLLSTALLHTSPASPTWHKFMKLAFSGQAHLDLPLPECPAPVPWVPCCVLLQCVCLGIIIVATNSIHWGVVWYKLIQPQSKSLHHLQLDQLSRFSCHLLPKHTWQTRFLLLRD